MKGGRGVSVSITSSYGYCMLRNLSKNSRGRKALLSGGCRTFSSKEKNTTHITHNSLFILPNTTSSAPAFKEITKTGSTIRPRVGAAVAQIDQQLVQFQKMSLGRTEGLFFKGFVFSGPQKRIETFNLSAVFLKQSYPFCLVDIHVPKNR